jgi:hypothetical protein
MGEKWVGDVAVTDNSRGEREQMGERYHSNISVLVLVGVLVH